MKKFSVWIDTAESVTSLAIGFAVSVSLWMFVLPHLEVLMTSNSVAWYGVESAVMVTILFTFSSFARVFLLRRLFRWLESFGGAMIWMKMKTGCQVRYWLHRRGYWLGRMGYWRSRVSYWLGRMRYRLDRMGYWFGRMRYRLDRIVNGRSDV